MDIREVTNLKYILTNDLIKNMNILSFQKYMYKSNQANKILPYSTAYAGGMTTCSTLRNLDPYYNFQKKLHLKKHENVQSYKTKEEIYIQDEKFMTIISHKYNVKDEPLKQNVKKCQSILEYNKLIQHWNNKQYININEIMNNRKNENAVNCLPLISKIKKHKPYLRIKAANKLTNLNTNKNYIGLHNMSSTNKNQKIQVNNNVNSELSLNQQSNSKTIENDDQKLIRIKNKRFMSGITKNNENQFIQTQKSIKNTDLPSVLLPIKEKLENCVNSFQLFIQKINIRKLNIKKRKTSFRKSPFQEEKGIIEEELKETKINQIETSNNEQNNPNTINSERNESGKSSSNKDIIDKKMKNKARKSAHSLNKINKMCRNCLNLEIKNQYERHNSVSLGYVKKQNKNELDIQSELICQPKTSKSEYNKKFMNFKNQNKNLGETEKEIKSMSIIDEKPQKKNDKKGLKLLKVKANDDNKEKCKEKNEFEKTQDKEKEKLKFKMKLYVPYDNFYSYIIAGGNNSGIIKRCLETRNSFWREIPAFNSGFNLKWQMCSKALIFEKLNKDNKQFLNHHEYHEELTRKDYLFTNLYTYCEFNRINVYEYVPLTFLVNIEDKSFSSNLEKFCKCFEIIQNELDNNSSHSIKNINKKIINLFPLTEKRTLSHCTPTIHKTHLSNRNIWLLKPTGFNRGRGVCVFDNLDLLKRLIKEYSEGVEEKIQILSNKENEEQNIESKDMLPNHNKVIGMIKSKNFIIQKYIETPLLIANRKFDIRAWVLVNHEMRVFLFREGYLRTSSQEYDISSESIQNRAVHLTNNAVQKYCEGYGNFEDGNQLSFPEFQEYLDNNYREENIDVKTNLYLQMKDLVNVSMQSVRKKLNPHERQYCFEIYGYDFIIDSEFKVWLIEINTNPCLEESSNILKILLPRMINDAFKLTIDEIFPKKVKYLNEEDERRNETNVFQVPGYRNDENIWEFVCQIGIIKNNIRSKIKKYNQDKYGNNFVESKKDQTNQKFEKENLENDCKETCEFINKNSGNKN